MRGWRSPPGADGGSFPSCCGLQHLDPTRSIPGLDVIKPEQLRTGQRILGISFATVSVSLIRTVREGSFVFPFSAFALFFQPSLLPRFSPPQ